MIKATDISLSFGQQIIFKGVSFLINGTEKIGLVGRNGAGKTTLLRAIAGQQPLSNGSITIGRDLTLAYLPQEVVLRSDKAIIIEALNTFNNLGDCLEEASILEDMIAHDVTVDKAALGTRLVELQHRLHDEHAREREQEAKEILRGLGFKDAQFQTPTNQLSVGWKMRLSLGKLLLRQADFYLFDEPTNHLDLPAKDWFLDFLRQAKFGYLLVSHNRYFLDHACDVIYDLSAGSLKVYHCNYSNFLVQKEQNQALLEKQYLEQQKYIKKQMETIQRFRASASRATTAQSMLKALEKIEPIVFEPTPKSVAFHFPPVQPSGKEVLTVAHLSIAFDHKPIFSDASFNIKRGHKVALIAPNGTGKTTLLNTIAGLIHPTRGSITWGHNVRTAFFEQNQELSLDRNKTVLEIAVDACPNSQARANVRSYLGAFLFSGEAVDKKVEVLSGGEKNRLAMVKILLQDANFLMLDEPTNHLDLASLEVLLTALKQYTGTILFVSHERDFLNRLATDLIELTPTEVQTYAGSYDDYLSFKELQSGKAASDRSSRTDKRDRKQTPSLGQTAQDSDREQQKLMSKLENKIARLEKEKGKLERELGLMTYGTKEFMNACTRLATVQKELGEQMEAWEQLFA
ncbi:MAG: ABC-F family ATP-binding cassette domain-containing protein [Candidatus Dependentiae bacterium]|nr:ABC-F family ATP-binding cassette domain-containing protein [Candidatus Dependentiae bacterium]